MFIQVMTANTEGLIDLPGGESFCLAPLAAGAKFPMEVLPDGLPGNALAYHEERTLTLRPFANLKAKATANSKWLAYVAGAGEVIGRAARKPVQLFDVTLTSGKTLQVPDAEAYYNLPTLQQVAMPPGIGPWPSGLTVWNLSRFKRVAFLAYVGLAIAPSPTFQPLMSAALSEAPLQNEPTQDLGMGTTSEFSNGGKGELLMGAGVENYEDTQTTRANRTVPPYGAFLLRLTQNGQTVFTVGEPIRLQAWGYFD